MHVPYRDTRLSHEVTTNPGLSDTQLEAEAHEVVALLQLLAVTTVDCEGCEPAGLIHASGILRLVRKALAARRFDPHTGSPTFYVPGRQLEFEFCPEGQLHVRAEDETILDRFWSRWERQGHAYGRRHGGEWDWLW